MFDFARWQADNIKSIGPPKDDGGRGFDFGVTSPFGPKPGGGRPGIGPPMPPIEPDAISGSKATPIESQPASYNGVAGGKGGV